MPSVFETLAADNLDVVYATTGVAATYTAPDGTTGGGANVTVRRQPEGFRGQADTTRAGREVQDGQLLVRVSELPAPVKTGRFAIVGETQVWTIETTPHLVNGQWQCRCQRSGVERIAPRRLA